MTLSKADLVLEVYKSHEGMTKAQASEAVETILRIGKICLTGGSDLLLSGNSVSKRKMSGKAATHKPAKR